MPTSACAGLPADASETTGRHAGIATSLLDFPGNAPFRGSPEWTGGPMWFIVGQSGNDEDARMLLGEHEHTIDDKNRLTLPARFRHHFAEGIVVTRGMDGCLYA